MIDKILFSIFAIGLMLAIKSIFEQPEELENDDTVDYLNRCLTKEYICPH